MNAIPQVIKDFLGSEKAIAAGLLVVAATIFVLTGKISFADWQNYTTNLLGIYVAGKTIQGTAQVFASRAIAPVKGDTNATVTVTTAPAEPKVE
jgi:uncharacterized membrane protein YadS